jgi:hypothetical protein
VPTAGGVLAQLDEIAEAQRDLPWPQGAGNRVRGPHVEAA